MTMSTTFKPGDRVRVSDRDQGRDGMPDLIPVGTLATFEDVADPTGFVGIRIEPDGPYRAILPSALDPVESDEAPEMVTSLLYALATATGQTPKTVALAHGIPTEFLLERDR
jgi:hypothetical protein